MGLVAAKCPNCGANIEVDMNTKAGICKYCGTAFVTQEAIVNFNTSIINNNIITNNIKAENVNIIAGKEEHYMKLAEDSLQCSDWDGVASNTTKALEINPENIRACLLQGIALGYSSTISVNSADLKVNKVFGAYKKYFISNNIQLTKDQVEDYLLMLLNLVNSIFKGASSAYDAGWMNSDSAKMLWASYKDCCTLVELSIKIAEKYNIDKENYAEILKINSTILKGILEKRSYNPTGATLDIRKLVVPEWEEYNKKYIANCEKIKKIDPIYSPDNAKQGGCYIATCVYGSYDCSPVWVLRRYRDNRLAKTWCGRSFIKFYYWISPKMVRLFGDRKWFKNIFKRPLDRKVKNLLAKGYLDTPYYDE